MSKANLQIYTMQKSQRMLKRRSSLNFFKIVLLTHLLSGTLQSWRQKKQKRKRSLRLGKWRTTKRGLKSLLTHISNKRNSLMQCRLIRKHKRSSLISLRRLLTSFTPLDSKTWKFLRIQIGKKNASTCWVILQKTGISLMQKKLPLETMLQRSLEQEVEVLKKSSDNLRNNMRVGLEIENHLKRRVKILEKDKVLLQEKIEKELSPLLNFRSKIRMEVMTLLKEGHSHLESTVTEVLEKVSQLESMAQQKSPETQDIELHENDCRDVHVNNDTSVVSTSAQRDDPDVETTKTEKSGDASEALAQALQEKVEGLLLLSQEEERHLLERNLNIALQKKIEELQRSLLQVTNEKVKTLMELAQLKQEHQVLRENANERITQGRSSTEIGEKRIMQEKEGKLKNLLKKSYLRHWVGNSDSSIENAGTQQNYEGNFNQTKSTNSDDFVRMTIENAAMNESVESMEQLTSSIRRLRFALLKSLKANESAASVDDIIVEARLLKTALGSSLPLSWSSDCDVESQVDRFEESVNSSDAESSTEKIDFVSAAGLEMVELLIFAAQVLKERKANRRVGTGSLD